MLMEVAPSLDYLTGVTHIDQGRCFSAYGSIKYPVGDVKISGSERVRNPPS